MLSYLHTPEHLTSILADYRSQLPQVRSAYADTGNRSDYRSSRGLWLKMIGEVRQELTTHTDTAREIPTRHDDAET
jgi:hypothetical protein